MIREKQAKLIKELLHNVLNLRALLEDYDLREGDYKDDKKIEIKQAFIDAVIRLKANVNKLTDLT